MIYVGIDDVNTTQFRKIYNLITIMSIMNIEVKELIIRKHLNGMALRDIADHLKTAKNIEISKDTVNNIINQ